MEEWPWLWGEPRVIFHCVSLGTLTEQPGGGGRQAMGNMNLQSQGEINTSLYVGEPSAQR